MISRTLAAAGLFALGLLLAAPCAAAQSGRDWLTPVRTTALRSVPEAGAALAVAADSVRVVDAIAGRLHVVSGGRAAGQPLGCGRGTTAAAHDVRALLLREDTLLLCDLRSGIVRSRGVAPRNALVLGGWLGGDAVVVAPGAAFGPMAHRLDAGTARSVGTFDPAGAAGLLEQVPGAPMPNLFVPVALAGENMLVANGATFDVAWVDRGGRIVHRHRVRGLPAAEWTDADRERMREMSARSEGMARIAETALAGPKPFFGRDQLEGDEQGRAWIGTSVGHPDSTLLVRVTPAGEVRRAWIRGRITRLAVRGDRLVLLVRRTERGRTVAEVREFRILR